MISIKYIKNHLVELKDKSLQDYNLFSYTTIEGVLLRIDEFRRVNIAEKKRYILTKICRDFKPDLSAQRKHLEKIKEALTAVGYKTKLCKVKTISRSIVGHSEFFGKVAFEVGLYFDPILNVPFIPGSTLKGAFRHALMELVYREQRDMGLNHREAENLAKRVASIVFGPEDGMGLVGVTDAYPVELSEEGLLFEPDVVTPHYPRATTELDVKPNPVPFLTVARGVMFQFYVYYGRPTESIPHGKRRRKLGVNSKLSRREFRCENDYVGYALFTGSSEDLMKELKRCSIDVSLIPLVDRALLYAFARGIGAKTSLGYSRFVVIEYGPVG